MVHLNSLSNYYLDGEEIRTTKGDFGESNVHDQSGISFRTPPYPDPDITESVKVGFNFEGFYSIDMLLFLILIQDR